MSYKIGLQVEEGLAQGFTANVEPSKRNIGIAMARKRGVANKPIATTSLEEDRAAFGGYLEGAHGYAVTKNLFRNCRGYVPTVYGMRIVGAGSTRATGTILLSGSMNLVLSASYKGEEDLGDWGNDVNVVLYPKGAKQSGKWVLEIRYKNRLVETYVSTSLTEIIEGTQQSSYVHCTLSSGQVDTFTFAKPLAGEITVAQSISATGSTFTLSEEPVGFTTPEGFVLMDANDNKIGTVATYVTATKTGTLTDLPLIVGTFAGAKFLEDVAHAGQLSGGVYNAPIESEFYGRTTELEKLGLDLFKSEDVQIVLNSEFHTKSMAIEGASFASDADVVYVANLPENSNLATAQDFASSIQTGTVSNIAIYNGWVKTIVDDVNYGYAPMIGCVVGAGYIRATAMQGDFIHIPPAGVDSALVDIVEVKGGKLSQAEVDRYVQDYSINVVKYQSGLGYFLLTSRTMSSNPLYHSVHIRLQTSFYKRVLRENYNWVLQKPNTPELKRSIYASLFTYFRNEYANGALESSVPYQTACVIIVDKRNNPVGQDRKLINVDIDWIPTECTEAVRMSMNRNDGQLILNEVIQN